MTGVSAPRRRGRVVRPVVITPFPNMMLLSPATAAAAVDRLAIGWSECVADLTAAARH